MFPQRISHMLIPSTATASRLFPFSRFFASAASSQRARPQTQQQQQNSQQRTPARIPRKDDGDAPSRDQQNSFVLHKRVLHIRQVARVTKGGKIRSHSAIVVVGNGDGVGGYGQARASDTSAAINKATANAIKNMTLFPRFQQRTIYGDIIHRFGSVNLEIRPASPGYGIIANNHIHEIARCLGIRDLYAKVRGSRNPLNVIKGTFEALKLQKTPDELALMRGRKVVDIANAYYGGRI